MINGIINVHKEAGFTSHDVVAKLRGIVRQKKIGHTGTLDPDATGVLPVCLGNATKLCDMLTDKDKTYEAVMLLGVTTDTQDTSGTIVTTKEVISTEEQILEAVMSFVGEYEQIPPMYSALKVNGKKLYELAREGIEIERKARPVKIHDISVKEINLETNEVVMTVSCSKGTYIRTLCYDIGEKLGCGACMKQLIRTKVSRFEIEDSLTLSQIEALKQEERLEECIVPVDEMFAHLTKVIIKEENSKFIYNGNPFVSAHIKEGFSEQMTTQIRVYDYKEDFIGIYEEKQAGLYKPVKMFL